MKPPRIMSFASSWKKVENSLRIYTQGLVATMLLLGPSLGTPSDKASTGQRP